MTLREEGMVLTGRSNLAGQGDDLGERWDDLEGSGGALGGRRG